MDVVEPMVSSSHGHDSPRPPQAFESITLREVAHEVVDLRAGWRLMPADSDIVFRPRSPFTWCHGELSASAGDTQHWSRSISIEFPMQRLNELGGCGLGKRSC